MTVIGALVFSRTRRCQSSQKHFSPVCLDLSQVASVHKLLDTTTISTGLACLIFRFVRRPLQVLHICQVLNQSRPSWLPA